MGSSDRRDRQLLVGFLLLVLLVGFLHEELSAQTGTIGVPAARRSKQAQSQEYEVGPPW
jgi:hypothetical protein